MMIRKYRALIPALVLVTAFDVHAEAVRQAAKDGMLLKLGNYTQQINVRAKAIGSSDCRVEFSVRGKTLVVVAPAGEYSEWVGIGPSFLEPAEVKLGVSVQCDAGAITQVKYHE